MTFSSGSSVSDAHSITEWATTLTSVGCQSVCFTVCIYHVLLRELIKAIAEQAAGDWHSHSRFEEVNWRFLLAWFEFVSSSLRDENDARWTVGDSPPPHTHISIR